MSTDRVIAVRFNGSSETGMGHIQRCVRLLSFATRFTPVFIVDDEECKKSLPVASVDVIALYHHGESYENESDDAKRTTLALAKYNVIALIVDDYRLSKTWESHFGDMTVLAFDDENNRSHACNILVDSNWKGEHETLKRYEHLTSPNTVRLLGPEYAVLAGKESAELKEKPTLSFNGQLRVLISLGGGGDVLFSIKIIDLILKLKLPSDRIAISLVVGPYSRNRQLGVDLLKKWPFVALIINESNLSSYMDTSDIYFGSSGTTMYEALARKIPSLTFSLAENQRYHHDHLADIGHYFHLNSVSENEHNDLAALLLSFVRNYEKIKLCYERRALISLDLRGGQRIYRVLESIIDGKKGQRGDYCQVELLNRAPSKEKIFRGLDHRSVNSYLDARYISINSQALNEQSKIGRLQHYLWWLNTKRELFGLFRGDFPLVYCWHELVENHSFPFIKGGFFAASEEATGLDVVDALLRHHQIVDRQYPGTPWYGFVFKNNSFARIVNGRLGFTLVEYSEDNASFFREHFAVKAFDKIDLYVKHPKQS